MTRQSRTVAAQDGSPYQAVRTRSSFESGWHLGGANEQRMRRHFSSHNGYERLISLPFSPALLFALPRSFAAVGLEIFHLWLLPSIEFVEIQTQGIPNPKRKGRSLHQPNFWNWVLKRSVGFLGYDTIAPCLRIATLPNRKLEMPQASPRSRHEQAVYDSRQHQRCAQYPYPR